MLTYLSFSLLALTIATSWSHAHLLRTPLWGWLLCTSMLMGLYAQLIQPIALLWIAIPVAGFIITEKKPAYYRVLIWPIGFYLLTMGMNLLPGFTRATLVEPELLGNSNIPVGLQYSFAKPVAGLLVLVFITQRCQSFASLWQKIQHLSHWLIPVTLVLGTGLLLGLAVDIKYVWWAPLFILGNTLFSVIPEEVFFRRFLQQPLQQHFGKQLWILLFTAILFTLAHTAPAHIVLWKFYFMMLVAGVAYAWSFYRSDAIEISILTHSGVNLLHFLVLTYPLTFS